MPQREFAWQARHFAFSRCAGPRGYVEDTPSLSFFATQFIGPWPRKLVGRAGERGFGPGNAIIKRA
jgi:hypothetical protein